MFSKEENKAKSFSICSVSFTLGGMIFSIIYGLVAVGISLIYTGLDVVNFSHGEFFMLGAFTGLTVYNFLIDGELIYAIFPRLMAGWVML